MLHLPCELALTRNKVSRRWSASFRHAVPLPGRSLEDSLQEKTMVTSKTDVANRATPLTTKLPGPQPHELIEGPSREELVRRHAFDLYERHGRVDGHALDDWLTAETEVARLVVDTVSQAETAVERG
jgi:hypothetical protein